MTARSADVQSPVRLRRSCQGESPPREATAAFGRPPKFGFGRDTVRSGGRVSTAASSRRPQKPSRKMKYPLALSKGLRYIRPTLSERTALPSSSGPGRRPLTAKTPVRVRLGVPNHPENQWIAMPLATACRGLFAAAFDDGRRWPRQRTHRTVRWRAFRSERFRLCRSARPEPDPKLGLIGLPRGGRRTVIGRHAASIFGSDCRGRPDRTAGSNRSRSGGAPAVSGGRQYPWPAAAGWALTMATPALAPMRVAPALIIASA